MGPRRVVPPLVHPFGTGEGLAGLGIDALHLAVERDLVFRRLDQAEFLHVPGGQRFDEATAPKARRRTVGIPPRIIMAPDQPVPSQMFGPRDDAGVRVAITPPGAGIGRRFHLLIAAGGVAGEQIGVIDDPRAPGATRLGVFPGPAGPAAFGDNVLEVLTDPIAGDHGRRGQQGGWQGGENQDPLGQGQGPPLRPPAFSQQLVRRLDLAGPPERFAFDRQFSVAFRQLL